MNDAGLILRKRTLTADGLEATFGVNHVGHFLLTNLLLDCLRPARQRITMLTPSINLIESIISGIVRP